MRNFRRIYYCLLIIPMVALLVGFSLPSENCQSITSSWIEDDLSHGNETQQDLGADLSRVLIAVNKLLLDEMHSDEDISGMDFNDMVVREFGSSRRYLNFASEIQKNIDKLGSAIMVDTDSREGLKSVLTLVFGEKESRIDWKGEMAKENSESRLCLEEYISAHQDCLIRGILSGLFQMGDLSLGANFANCIRAELMHFDRCVN